MLTPLNAHACCMHDMPAPPPSWRICCWCGRTEVASHGAYAPATLLVQVAAVTAPSDVHSDLGGEDWLLSEARAAHVAEALIAAAREEHLEEELLRLLRRTREKTGGAGSF